MVEGSVSTVIWECEQGGEGWATSRKKSCALGVRGWKGKSVWKEEGARRAGEVKEGGRSEGG